MEMSFQMWRVILFDDEESDKNDIYILNFFVISHKVFKMMIM
jgi:hypothetical protein